jgi:flagellar basal-body rod modification protein FlgD
MTLAGRSVLVNGNAIDLAAAANGAAVDSRGGVSLAANADSVKVDIKNAAGAVVRTIDLGSRSAGMSSFHWDGLDDAGKPLAAGTYSFNVTATAAGQPVTSQALTAAHVEGVNRSASGIQLDLGSRGTVAYTDVQQVL